MSCSQRPCGRSNDADSSDLKGMPERRVARFGCSWTAKEKGERHPMPSSPAVRRSGARPSGKHVGHCWCPWYILQGDSAGWVKEASGARGTSRTGNGMFAIRHRPGQSERLWVTASQRLPVSTNISLVCITYLALVSLLGTKLFHSLVRSGRQMQAVARLASDAPPASLGRPRAAKNSPPLRRIMDV